MVCRRRRSRWQRPSPNRNAAPARSTFLFRHQWPCIPCVVWLRQLLCSTARRLVHTGCADELQRARVPCRASSLARLQGRQVGSSQMFCSCWLSQPLDTESRASFAFCSLRLTPAVSDRCPCVHGLRLQQRRARPAGRARIGHRPAVGAAGAGAGAGRGARGGGAAAAGGRSFPSESFTLALPTLKLF